MAVDLLGLQPSVISKDIRSKYLLLAGVPKIGKTEFCTLAPKPLILAFEKGTNARPSAFVQPIEKWSEFKQVLRQLEQPEVQEKFYTVCIDTISIAYDCCEKFICQQAGVQKVGDIPFGGGYAALSKEFENALRRITMLNYGLIMTAHLKETGSEESGDLGYKPDLNNRCLKIVNGLADVIGVITQEWDENGESKRWIQTRASKNTFAGSRFRFLAPKIPFGYKEFSEAIATAIEEEEKLGAVVVDHLNQEKTESLSFVSVRNEARELWTKLVGEGENVDEEMAKRIMKRIEMIFGRQMKLSEITEDQTDLMQLAVLEMRDLLAEKAV